MTLSVDNIGTSDLSTIKHYRKNKGKIDNDYIRFCWVMFGYTSIAIANAAIESIRVDSKRSYGGKK